MHGVVELHKEGNLYNIYLKKRGDSTRSMPLTMDLQVILQTSGMG